MKKTTIFGIALVLSLSLILGACSSSAAQPAIVRQAENAIEEALDDEDDLESNPVTLKIAVLPIIDTLPLLLAHDEGIFESFGLDVELIRVSSAPELSQMVASGQADGMLTDGLTVLFFNKEEIQVQIVRYGQKPSENTGHFFILAAKDSGITSPEQLKDVEIGISEGTIIEYVTDRLLEKEGFTGDEIKTIAVPKIPERMALLASGELQAAVLPDPLASLAVQEGATIILDDSQSPEYGASVYVFTTEMINENPSAIRAFVEVIDIATRLLVDDPEEYKSVLVDNKLIPPPLMESYTIPPFPYGIYSLAEWDDTLTWARTNGFINVIIPYEEAVNRSFLK